MAAKRLAAKRTTTRRAATGRVTAPKPKAPQPQLVLVKVLVQPVLSLVDASGAGRDVQHPVVEVQGADWATWAAAAFTPERLEELRQSVGPAEAS